MDSLIHSELGIQKKNQDNIFEIFLKYGLGVRICGNLVGMDPRCNDDVYQYNSCFIKKSAKYTLIFIYN